MNDLERSLAFDPNGKKLLTVKNLPTDELPSISVVIPSFNQGEFIRETLDSVLAQAYPNMDIYIADGGSTDGSLKILEEYHKLYPDLIRYDSRQDGGHHNGVNKGIANTSGQIIAWINSDDVYLPDAFWKIATFFYFNQMALVVYGRNRYVDCKLQPVVDYPVDWSPLLCEQRRRMLHFCIITQPSLFFKRDAVKFCGALASKILDYELWMRWQTNLPFYFCDDYLSLSRLQEDAITVNANKKLLREICKTVHDYYGVVPFSWAFRYAFTERFGAAWTRGESPAPGRKVYLIAYWYWVSMNLRWFLRLIGQLFKDFAYWASQSRRISS
jgi:glycosyltransferase involved in cell wall biosynthesis